MTAAIPSAPRGRASYRGALGRGMIAIALFLALGPAPAHAGEEVTIDGVVHVRNGATPSQGQETMKLKELWRVGGDDDDVFFGLVSQVLQGEDGTIYCLDAQLSEVQVFSPTGEALGTLSREGDGPGEVRRPIDMAWMADGSLGLLQFLPGRLVKVNTDNTPAGMLAFDNDPERGFPVIMDVECRAGNLALAGLLVKNAPPSGQERTSFLARFSDAGEESLRYLEKTSTMDFTNLNLDEAEQYFVYPRRWTIGPQGRVYAAPERDRYVVNVYAPDGTLERVIEREFEPRDRTQQEKDRLRAVFEAQTANFPGEASFRVCETEVAITSIEVTDEGEIWISNCRSGFEQPEGILTTYDVFDLQGHFVKQVAVECAGDGLNDGLILMEGDRVVQLTDLVPAAMQLQGGGAGVLDEDEEPEPMEVIYYQIEH